MVTGWEGTKLCSAVCVKRSSCDATPSALLCCSCCCWIALSSRGERVGEVLRGDSAAPSTEASGRCEKASTCERGSRPCGVANSVEGGALVFSRLREPRCAVLRPWLPKLNVKLGVGASGSELEGNCSGLCVVGDDMPAADARSGLVSTAGGEWGVCARS